MTKSVVVHVLSKKLLRRKEFWIAAGGVFTLLIMFAGLFAVQGTIVDSSKRKTITFYQVSSGAYGQEEVVDVFKSSYAGVRGDTAVIGSYKFKMSKYGKNSAGDGCFIIPTVSKNGEVVDSYSLQGKKVQVKAVDSDKNREAEYGPISASFGNPFYMDYDTWYGNGQVYVLSVNCYGPLNRYKLTVPFNQVSVDTSLPGNITEGNSVVVKTKVENGWKPLEADLSAEVCVTTVHCNKVSKENVSIPVGGKTIRFTVVNPEPTKKVSMANVDVSGRIGVDTDKFNTKNVAVDCDADGVNEKPSNCDMIMIGKIKGETGAVEFIERKQKENKNQSKAGDKDLSFIEKKIKVLLQILTYS